MSETVPAPRGVLRHDGLRFEVVDAGPRAGEPVVLLHGFPQRATSWELVSPILSRAGLRTLALDQRGYSPGARPRGRAAYRVQKLVGDVVALIDQVRAPVHLVGHDWGAAVAWALASSRPELLRSLTAVSVPHPRAMASALTHGQLLASWYMGFFQLPWVPERFLTRLASQDDGRLAGSVTPATWRRFQDEVVAAGALPGGLAWYRALPFADPRVTGRVSVPTTLVWSNRDEALVRYGAEHTGDHVDADYRFVELDGGHFIPEEQPGALAQAILHRTGRG